MFNVVLFNPQIPQNTGNIARTCAVTGTDLHLIRPLGFKIDDKSLKRAGLDYWKDVNVFVYDNFEDFLLKKGEGKIYLLSSKVTNNYADVKYSDGDYLLFGSETSGVPENIHNMLDENGVRIPMLDNENARCLNLSNSVNIVLYEALRQNGFFNMR